MFSRLASVSSIGSFLLTIYFYLIQPHQTLRLVFLGATIVLIGVVVVSFFKIEDTIREFSDSLEIQKEGKFSVFYPVRFSKIPHLKIKTAWIDAYDLVEQREDGFVVEAKRLLAPGLFGKCTLTWRAKGPVSR